MNDDEIKALETYVKTIVPANSCCLVQVPENEVQQCAESLNRLNEVLCHLGIILIACPLTAKLTVIPQGSEVNLENERPA